MIQAHTYAHKNERVYIINNNSVYFSLILYTVMLTYVHNIVHNKIKISKNGMLF